MEAQKGNLTHRAKIRLGKDFERDLACQIRNRTIVPALVDLFHRILDLFWDTEEASADRDRVYRTITFVIHTLCDKVIRRVSDDDVENIMLGIARLIEDTQYYVSDSLRAKLYAINNLPRERKVHEKKLKRASKVGRNAVSTAYANRPKKKVKTKKPDRKPSTMADQLAGLLFNGELVTTASPVKKPSRPKKPNMSIDLSRISGTRFVVFPNGKKFHKVGSPEANRSNRGGRLFQSAQEAMSAGYTPSARIMRELMEVSAA